MKRREENGVGILRRSPNCEVDCLQADLQKTVGADLGSVTEPAGPRGNLNGQQPPNEDTTAATALSPQQL